MFDWTSKNNLYSNRQITTSKTLNFSRITLRYYYFPLRSTKPKGLTLTQKDSMLIQCPSCHTTYKVSDNLITTPNPTFRCSRCKHIFVLGLKIEPAPTGETTVASATPPSEEEEPELNFSFTPPGKTEITKEASRQVPESREAEQPPEAESMAQAQAEPSESPTNTSPSPPEAIPAPSPAVAEPQLAPDIERSLPLAQEKDDSWSIAPSPTQSEEPFTIPEEKPSLQMDSPSESAPDFGADWQESYPTLDEGEPDSALDPYQDRPLSNNSQKQPFTARDIATSASSEL
ncbi:MAG: zinc-ribbon domain-containing protein [Deltaproteobacteria bacterium]|nr:zinc-ribbon domain-containing protein [Deltaproteobacteria bacterium]